MERIRNNKIKFAIIVYVVIIIIGIIIAIIIDSQNNQINDIQKTDVVTMDDYSIDVVFDNSTGFWRSNDGRYFTETENLERFPNGWVEVFPIPVSDELRNFKNHTDNYGTTYNVWLNPTTGQYETPDGRLLLIIDGKWTSVTIY